MYNIESIINMFILGVFAGGSIIWALADAAICKLQKQKEQKNP